MFPHLFFENITIDDISHVFNKNIEVSVLRLDKLHPVISGNKWFKLRYYIDEAKRSGKKNVVTFGGAWSNHIVAIAAACKINELNSIGIIRGEEPAMFSDTLINAKEWGMQLVFISREEYKQKTLPAEFLSGEYYIINEGGYGITGAKGAATILDHCNKDFTHYCCAAGTGTMMAGLINSSSADKRIVGISVMKNNTGLEEMIKELLAKNSNSTTPQWDLLHDYHFGGYAKYNASLIAFMNDFYQKTQIPSDFVYTAKLFYAINDLLNKKFFPDGSKMLVIHSGGLQGNLSFPKGTLIF